MIDQKSVQDLRNRLAEKRQLVVQKKAGNKATIVHLFSELDEQIFAIQELFDKLNSELSIDSMDRELIAQCSINISAVQQICRRRKLEDWQS